MRTLTSHGREGDMVVLEALFKLERQAILVAQTVAVVHVHVEYLLQVPNQHLERMIQVAQVEHA